MTVDNTQPLVWALLFQNSSLHYNGKTISVIVRNFCAEVVLYEWDSVDIVLAENDRARFRSVYDLTRDVQLHGYYGGIWLIKATIKHFVEYCQARKLKRIFLKNRFAYITSAFFNASISSV